MDRLLDALVTDVERARNIHGALDALACAVCELGFERVDYVSVDAPVGPDRVRPLDLVYRNFPRDWERRWSRFRYCDPIYLAGLNTTLPVDMVEYRGSGSPFGIQREAWRYLDDVGMSQSILVPVHLPTGRFCSVALYSSPDQPAALWRSVFEHNRARLMLIGHCFVEAVSTRFTSPTSHSSRARLTRRERECLSLIASGKTTMETAGILGCSYSTVRFHLDNATRKLGTRNRANTIALAYARGVLGPDGRI